MTTFLFWNIKKNPVHSIVASLARQHRVDVVMLVECANPGTVLRALNYPDKYDYYYVPGLNCKKVEIFSRFTREFIPIIYEEDRLSIRHLQLPGLTNALLAVTHFPSKMHWSSASQTQEIIRIGGEIRRTESKVGHSKTILVGDLNMNPFESGVIGTMGLHGVMSKQISESGGRVVQGKNYPYFYNPMWSLFGDITPGPPGTYFYRRAEHEMFFWNMFDQVLIRSDLQDRFIEDSLRILTTFEGGSLLTPQQVPDANKISDHLPLIFEISL